MHESIFLRTFFKKVPELIFLRTFFKKVPELIFLRTFFKKVPRLKPAVKKNLGTEKNEYKYARDAGRSLRTRSPH